MTKYFTNFTLALVIASIGAFLILRNVNFSALMDDSCDNKTIAKTIQSITDKYFVDIIYTQDTKALPQKWQEEPINGKAQAIKIHNLCRAIEILAPEFKKYPQKTIQQVLKKIVFFSNLTFHETNYGGTSLNNAIYLVIDDSDKGYTKEEIIKVFHHELSSIFLYEKSFVIDDWMSANEDAFNYKNSAGETLSSIKQGIEKNVSESTYQSGFLSEYGKSSLENDFNLYAEILFFDPQKLEHLSSRYPRVRKKAALIKNHYLRFSPEFKFVK